MDREGSFPPPVVFWEQTKNLPPTRTAWVKMVPTFSSSHARLFLQEIRASIPYPLHSIHTDNGSEFQSLFDQAVAQLNLTHLWSPPRSPKIHSHIERFNGVLQNEFIDYYVDMAIVEPLKFRQQLTDWILWYNTKRPHHALQLMTPYQYLVHLQKGAESLKCP
ncbi:transposase [Candidatus Gottesmanbacteria bacterium]|nr:transposase [Candidatus Gottesmanbacteria bacterium]